MKHRSRNVVRHYANTAEFCFYGELNAFLPERQRKQIMLYRFNGRPGIKDPIEVLGVPHPEVGEITVNGESVDFHYQLQNGDRVAVYPISKGSNMNSSVKLREEPPRKTAFVVDVNLGRLARLLRLLGFDALYNNAFGDKEIVDLSTVQNRIILTRDRRLLHDKRIVFGYWVRSVEPVQQLAEVVARYDISDLIQPFRRCTECNGVIERVEKERVLHLLEPKTKKYYEVFYRCPDCGKVYWQGSHIDHVKDRFAQYLS